MSLLDELEREKAHADSMTAMAHHWMARAQKAEADKIAMLIAMTRAAGGEIRVHHLDLMAAPRLELVQCEDFSRNEIVLRVRELGRQEKLATDA